MADVRDIVVNDAVLVENCWWRVIGTLTFTDDEGWSWPEHLLLAADGQRRWLTVEDDDKLLVVLWTPTHVSGVEPGHHEMIHSGVSYKMHEYGRCHYAATGQTGTPPGGMMDYYDYAARGGIWLGFERFGESGWEMSTGATLAPGDVVVQKG